MYALTIEYNDHAPLTAKSGLHAGLGLTIYNSDDPFVHLRIMIKREEQDRSDYWLKTIRRGDRLRITYRLALPSDVDNIAEIGTYERPDEHYEVTRGQRIGIDVDLKDRGPIRLSHPPDGYFDVIFGNVPLTHARCQVLAASDVERWAWQLDDLYPDMSMGLTFVETTWNTPFPRVCPIAQDD
jgi:hypothetical protein